jgi:hypothetical protein
MSANKPAGEDKKDTTVVADHPQVLQGALKHCGSPSGQHGVVCSIDIVPPQDVSQPKSVIEGDWA